MDFQKAFHFREIKPVDEVVYQLCKMIMPVVTEQELFQTNEYFALAAMDDFMPIGQISVRIREESLQIIDLCVFKRYRRQGIATDLVSNLIDFAAENQLGVDCIFSTIGDTVAKQFFESPGDFDVTARDGMRCEVAREDFVKVDKFNKVKISGKAEKLCDLTGKEKALFFEQLRSQTVDFTKFCDRNAMVSELCFLIRDGDKINTSVFFEQEKEGVLQLSFAYCKPECQLAFIELLELARQAMENREDIRTIVVNAVSENAISILHTVFKELPLQTCLYEASLRINE